MKRRYAFITAGAQGLGQAITRHLAAQHYTLFVHYYTSQPAADALQAELTAAGGEVMPERSTLALRAYVEPLKAKKKGPRAQRRRRAQFVLFVDTENPRVHLYSRDDGVWKSHLVKGLNAVTR